MKVICDNCTKTFRIKRIRDQLSFDDEAYGKVTFYYFKCPKCKKKYVTHTENAQIRELIKDIKKLQAKMSLDLQLTSNSQYQIYQDLAELRLMKRTVQDIQTYLKEKYNML